jgi:hypothetical protein
LDTFAQNHQEVGDLLRPFCEASLIALWKKKESTGKIEQKSDGLP